MIKRLSTPLLALSLCLPLLAQCAATSTATSEENATALGFEVPEGKGVVYLFRPGRAVGAGVQIPVKVNGVDAGGTGPGTYFRWELLPGTYTFWSQTSEASATVRVDLAEGQTVFVEQNPRIGLDSGRVTMKVVSEAAGKRAVQSSKLLVSAYLPEE